jgi:AraC-like DNA-binding protein
MYEAVNLRMELVGRSPPDTVFAVVPTQGQKVWFNGQRLRENELGLIGPDNNILLVIPGNSRTVSMQVPMMNFLAYFRKSELSKTGSFVFKQGRVISDTVRVKRICRLMMNSRYRETSGEWPHVVENSLMNSFQDLIYSNFGQWKKLVKPAIANKFLRFRKVDRFVTQNLHEPIAISDLTRAANVSERTLERQFKSEFGMTPTAYITARRLHNVKTELIYPAVPGRSIAQIAMDQGFEHLGRFSSTYREHFGKTPSLFRQSFREYSARL